jgi:hypothetical protein
MVPALEIVGMDIPVEHMVVMEIGVVVAVLVQAVMGKTAIQEITAETVDQE